MVKRALMAPEIQGKHPVSRTGLNEVKSGSAGNADYDSDWRNFSTPE